MASRGCPQQRGDSTCEVTLAGPGASGLVHQDAEDVVVAATLRAGRSVAFQPCQPGTDTARAQSALRTVRPGMWPDVCMRLQCAHETPVKVLTPVDLTDGNGDRVLDQLHAVDRVVVIMPDRQDTYVWQILSAFTQKRYFYRPQARLLGVAGLSHWALLVDWTKRVDFDDTITPDHVYSIEELSGKFQWTKSAKRRHRKRQFESQEGFIPRSK